MQSPPVALSPKDKLEIIRLVDCFHPWRSLEEKRECRRCGAVFTGTEIVVRGGAYGPLGLQCPTGDCCSVPIEWMMLPEEEAAPKLATAVAPLQKGGKSGPVYSALSNRGGHRASFFSFLRVVRPL